MNKNYNYTREQLILPEYGRHIHKLVEGLLNTPDRALRTQKAHAIIKIMGNVNTDLRDSKEFAHKLWDHLHIISDFRLDIDGPYPSPSRESLEMRPQKMDYPTRRVEFRHYGKHASRMLQSLVAQQKQVNLERELRNIACYMRNSRSEYNNDHPSGAVIVKDIKIITNNGIAFNEDALINAQNEHKSSQTAHPHKGKAQQQKKGKQKKSNKTKNKS
ncbi:MAG: DUF4290 domain-containing protein [Alistipes sp.]|nr:DUF4290 domain-containing protein [Alistipes sp.]